MLPNLQFLGDLVTFTEEIRNGELHCLCSGDTSHSMTDLHIRASSPWVATLMVGDFKNLHPQSRLWRQHRIEWRILWWKT